MKKSEEGSTLNSQHYGSVKTKDLKFFSFGNLGYLVDIMIIETIIII
jgi:hypothetical protein